MEPCKSPFSIKVNYLYFGIFFSFLTFLSASGIFTKEHLSGSRFFFFLYAMGQAGLETALFIFLAAIIGRFLGKFCFALFIGCTFVFFILHLFDFLMDRILALSVWETLGFVFDESFENFLYLLDASGIPLWTWLLFFIFIACLPLFGFLLYRATEKVIAPYPILVRGETFLQLFFCLPAALLFWDFSASRVIHPDAYTAFLQSLPWKSTFLQPRTVFFPLAHSVKAPPRQEAVLQAIEEDPTLLKTKPNIYLFITESLRADCITREGAPHLAQFREESVPSDLTLSGANGTHLSWFSIFHSQYPFFWNRIQKEGWNIGSPALKLLKKWGYQVRLYTSAQLGYYGMEKLLFGSDLLDSYQTFHHTGLISAADSDGAALAKIQQDLKENPSLSQGQVFIAFWDSTHFDYSWPKKLPPKFTPFAKEFAYFKAFQSKQNIELIKNRYRNSVHYIDTLFADFLAHLPRPEEAIVVFVGDHGEEFFDHGHLFHGSHLVHEQTHVPLFIRLGSAPLPKKVKLLSHLDIFPTIFHHLSGRVLPFFRGESAFAEKRRPYAITARFNASRAPYEFCLHNGTHKLIAQFSNRHNIFDSKSIKIRSLRTRSDQPAFLERSDVREWMEQEFGPALHHLFSSQ